MLQERLSGFTDAVECHLQEDICRRSDSFFEALGVLTELLNGIAATRERVDGLRASVRLLDETVVGAALRLAALQARRRNARALLALLQALEGVETALGDLGLLLEAADFAAAIDVLEEARRALAVPELAQLHAARPAAARLDAAAALALRQLVSEFVRVARPPRLRGDALPAPVAAALARCAGALQQAEAKERRGGEAAPVEEAGPSAAAGGEPEDEAGDGEEEEGALGAAVDEELLAAAARPVLAALLRLGGLSAALRRHREALQLEVRAAVKEVLGLALVGGGGGDRSLGDRLRSLPLAAYCALLEATAAALLAVVRRAAAVHELVCALPAAEGGDRDAAARESGEALAAAAEAAAQRWAKLLLVRAPVHVRLRVGQLAQVAAATAAFADALDACCGSRRAAVLRATLSSQAKALLCGLHEQAASRLAASLEAEQWSRCDVPPAFQALADGLLRAGAGLEAAAGAEAAEEAAPTLALGGASFACVASSLLLLRTLAQYVEFGAALPSLASEALHRALEALKLFNSRSCALVLGAGALGASSGLRSISAKHLALASQQLLLALALLPHVRAALSRALPPARQALLLTASERCDADMRLHRQELHSKIASLSAERLLQHLGTLEPAASAWAAQPALADPPPPSELAETVTADVRGLGAMLSPLLPPEEAAPLFQRVAAAFDRSLSEGLARAAEAGGGARAHAAADAAALAAALSELPGCGEHGAPALLALAATLQSTPAAEAADAPPADTPAEEPGALPAADEPAADAVAEAEAAEPSLDATA